MARTSSQSASTEPTLIAGQRSVALVTLGCARNDVDSQELAGRLTAAGWQVVPEAADADVAVVNTCGFIDEAKQDSIDTILQAADVRDSAQTRTQAVVAVGCMAQRYGTELADNLPEADAVLGFDSYAELSDHLTAVLGGHRPASHQPTDRRLLLPITPVARPQAAQSGATSIPGHGTKDLSSATGAVRPTAGPPVFRHRLDDAPWASLKLASGCDRRCAFCAIPRFRGSFVSRPPDEVVAEARWLAEQGVRELYVVSENTTSYGKDLGDLRLLESLVPQLANLDGIDRVRLSYLQPAEMRPSLIEVMTQTEGVAAYFDLSFQHASPTLLRRMRRFGGTEDFLALIEQIRTRNPHAGIRTNVIVGFPGETEADVSELREFLTAARCDVVGVFDYSDEEDTEAQGLPDHLPAEVIAARGTALRDLVEHLNAQRAEDRIGETVRVLVEGIEADDDEPMDNESTEFWGRAEHQGPQTDGVVLLPELAEAPDPQYVGRWVDAVVTTSTGVDLIAQSVQTAGRP